jgi:hypothetical protein
MYVIEATALGFFCAGFSLGVVCATPAFREGFFDGLALKFLWKRNGK